MEDGLLYLYYSDDNKERSIDFGSQYKFRFDLNTKTLYVEDNPQYIPNFYNTKGINNIRNLSLLVGANGSGKTSLLHRIIGSMGMHNRIYTLLDNTISFYILRVKGINYIVIDDEHEIIIEPKKDFEIIDTKEAFDLIRPSYNVILLSNIFDPFHRDNMLSILSSCEDLTTSDRYQEQFDFVEEQLELERKKQSENQFKGKLRGDQKDFDEIVNLLFSNENIDFLFKYKKSIQFNRNIEILISRLEFIRQDTINEETQLALEGFIRSVKNFNKKFDKEFEKVPDRYSRSNFNLIYIKKSLILFFYGLAYIHLTSTTKKNKQYGHDVPFSNYNTDQYFDEDIDESFNNLKTYIKEVCKQDSLFEFIFGLFKLIDNSESITPNLKDLSINDLDVFREVFALYKKANLPFHYFKFNIEGTSSGEYAILVLFARLYGWKQEQGENIRRNILLLIDEADLYLHPQWQKQIIYKFIEFSNLVFEKHYVQIIMTTNNAIPVSDVLKYNTVLLGNNQKQSFDNYRNTFGGNIFNLLNDTFFIQNGFIGEFAQSKIQELINILYEEDFSYLTKHMVEIENIINLIGEDLIRNKLLEILEQRLKANLISMKKDIDEIKDFLSTLKKEKKDE